MALHLIAQAARDSLNHVITLVGYFEGYDARGELQLSVEAKLPPIEHPRLQDALDRVHVCMELMEEELLCIVERGNYSLVPGGPCRPGIPRTLEIAEAHLSALSRMLLELVEQMARDNSALKKKAQQLRAEFGM